MARICVLITTYDREEKLFELIRDIAHNAQGHDVYIRVYDDGSPVPYANEYIEHRFAKNNGKKGYWKVIGKMFEDIKNTHSKEYEYYIQLPDDVRLVDGFFDHAIKQYEAIGDGKKICLNLLLDKSREGKPCWTKVAPVKIKYGKEYYWKTQWVDMCYIAKDYFFATLDYEIKPINGSRWNRNQLLGSGVGEQISRRLNDFGYSLYQVTETLVKHGDHESKMNEKARKNTKLIA